VHSPLLVQSSFTCYAFVTNVAKQSSAVTASELCLAMLLAIGWRTQLCGAPAS
jgi:heme/copper-type cytochrome/quinol oxidase subunit 3